MKEISVGDWNYLVYDGRSSVGVVLVHEIQGQDDYSRSVASLLSDSGYWVVLVDLFKGRHASGVEEGRSLRASIKNKEIIDCLAGGWHLLREKVGSAGQTGTMGFCMGGGVALSGACNLEFDFCIDYYGMIDDVEEIAGLKGPLVLILGSEDQRVTPWAFQTLLPAFVKHKKRLDMHLYPSAGHAFHRPNWKGNNAEAAQDAWSKTMIFLEGRRRVHPPHFGGL